MHPHWPPLFRVGLTLFQRKKTANHSHRQERPSCSIEERVDTILKAFQESGTKFDVLNLVGMRWMQSGTKGFENVILVTVIFYHVTPDKIWRTEVHSPFSISILVGQMLRWRPKDHFQ
jgi:hypothetical protein